MGHSYKAKKVKLYESVLQLGMCHKILMLPKY